VEKDDAIMINFNSLKMVLLLAVPVIIENFLQVLLGMTDTYFVSKISGEAIGAVGMTNLFMNVLIAFFIAIGTGTVALTARAYGGGEKQKVSHIGTQAIALSLYVGIGFGLFLYLFSDGVLTVLGARGSMLTLARVYFRVVAVPSVALSLLMVVSNLFRAIGNTKIPLKVGVVMNILNILLDVLLIFGWGPIPGLGILGAGIATTLSRVFAAGLLLYLWIRDQHQPGVESCWKDYLLLKGNAPRGILSIGMPAGVEKLFMRFGQLLYGWMIIKIGTADYIGHNIAGTIESVSYLPAMGFGVAASTLVGQHLGAKDHKKAVQDGWSAFLMGSLFMILIAQVFFFGGEWLAMQYSQDPIVISKVRTVLKLIALFQPFLCSTVVISSALQGAGETRFPMYLTVIGIWGIRIVGVYVLGIRFGWGLLGVWISYATDIVFRGSLLLWYYGKGEWKKIKLPEISMGESSH